MPVLGRGEFRREGELVGLARFRESVRKKCGHFGFRRLLREL